MGGGYHIVTKNTALPKLHNSLCNFTDKRLNPLLGLRLIFFFSQALHRLHNFFRDLTDDKMRSARR